MKRIGEIPSQKFSVEGFFLQTGSEIKEHDKTPGGTVPCEQLRIISAPLYISIESTKNEGEADLYDYGFSVLEQYELTVKSTARTRGGLLCQTTEVRQYYVNREAREKNFRSSRSFF